MIPGIESIRLIPEVSQATWVEVIRVNGDPPFIHIHGDLIDPVRYRTVYHLALVLGCTPGKYTVYSRHRTGELDALEWTTQLTTGLTVVLVGGILAGGFDRLHTLLAQRSEILPSRMRWPGQY